ncbi:MAG: translation initiation factor Sui1 [Magnetococcales bacterium]|nr:translation initiation factor Sui1 [Magnetococcales bacterium]
MKAKKTTDRFVYSTDQGRICPDCGKPASGCVCSQKGVMSESDGIVRVSRETKGRAGKIVTVIKGVALEKSSLAQLGKKLKRGCGSGGTVKNGVIEIQGDHVERVMDALKKEGWTVKRAGG